MFGTGTADDLLKTRENGPVTHFIVHSVATTAHAVTSANDFLADQQRAHPELIAFGAMHPDFPDKEAEVARALDLGLHGFKLHPDTQHVNLDDPRLMEFYEIIEGRAPVVIHMGDYRYGYSRPSRLKRVLEAFPDLVVDAAHLGGWSVFDRAFDELGAQVRATDRVFLDASSTSAFVGARHLGELMRLWGCEHVMFGSDYPMWSPAAEYEALVRSGLSDAELECVLWRNAERFAGVDVENT